jgi:hypothetical protein
VTHWFARAYSFSNRLASDKRPCFAAELTARGSAPVLACVARVKPGHAP